MSLAAEGALRQLEAAGLKELAANAQQSADGGLRFHRISAALPERLELSIARSAHRELEKLASDKKAQAALLSEERESPSSQEKDGDDLLMRVIAGADSGPSQP